MRRHVVIVSLLILMAALSMMLGACQDALDKLPKAPITMTPSATSPATATPTVTPIFLYYTVKRGDTLWTIAKEYGIDVDILTQVNELDDPAAIQVGQELLIAEHVTISGRYLPTATPTITPTPTPRPCTQGCTYPHPGCEIKGIIARLDGKRLYLMPGDELYQRREADLWFCHPLDAERAGWQRWTEYGPAGD